MRKEPTNTSAGQRPASLFSWRGALALALAIAALRILYLALLCPYELVADEAQYWDWSRRLDLSYYSKGPGVAWAIHASTLLLGDAEWVIRLPAVTSIAVATLAVARTAHSMSLANGRVAFLAAAAFSLIPAFQVAGLLMTIDAPFLACWALAAWCAWEITRANLDPAIQPPSSPHLRWWLGLGAALGLGFLFKYTILLILPGLLGFALTHGRFLLWRRASLTPALFATTLFLALCAPVLIWNHSRGWPTIAHLLGHLGAPGGDIPHPRPLDRWTYNPIWTLSFLAAQLGAIGPILALMLYSPLALLRNAQPNKSRDPALAFCLWLGLPIIAFYTLVSILTDAEGNWPIAGYLTLIIPVARLAADELPRHRALVRAWIAAPLSSYPGARRPRAGFIRRRPETLFQIAWDWTLGYGVVAAGGALLLSPLAQLPLVGSFVPYYRLSGQRDFAHAANLAARAAMGEDSKAPFVVADSYGRAALLAYYLPHHPTVRSAASLMGGRKSSYDYFPDTALDEVALLGAAALLVGSNPDAWEKALAFDSLDLLLPPSPPAQRRPGVYLGRNYKGPRTRAPRGPATQ